MTAVCVVLKIEHLCQVHLRPRRLLLQMRDVCSYIMRILCLQMDSEGMAEGSRSAVIICLARYLDEYFLGRCGDRRMRSPAKVYRNIIVSAMRPQCRLVLSHSVRVCRVHIAADGNNNSPVVGTSDKSNLVRRKMIRCDTGPSRRHFAWLGDGWEKGQATMAFLKPWPSLSRNTAEYLIASYHHHMIRQVE